jgi:endonuclease G
MSTNTEKSRESLLRTGYSADFLGTIVEVPFLDAAIGDDAVLWEGSEVIPYTHFSLSLSASRRLPRWVGWNIDGADLLLLSRNGIDFAKDPRLPAETQSGNELYAGNRLDRGHLARRSDLLWGELPEAQQANRDSSYYGNIAPQIDDFNQSSQDGLWGRLENALYEDVDVQDLRASVFAGPVFRPDDRLYRGVALPSEYWKLLVFLEDGVLKARAFLLTQDLDQLRAVLALDEFRVYQITIAELEARTQLHFPQEVHQAGALPAGWAMSERRPLGTAGDISW